LYDEGDKQEIFKKEIPEDVTIEKIAAALSLPSQKILPKDLHHLIRILFSCLVDADYLDTERFMIPKQAELRKGKSSIEELLKMLEKFLAKLKSKVPITEVNIIRDKVQQWCIKASDGNIDFYSLTVPTGGGKTLSSVLWALRHAKKNGLKRIIIAIPYTSIITQTASVLRDIFGDDRFRDSAKYTVISEGCDGELNELFGFGKKKKKKSGGNGNESDSAKESKVTIEVYDENGTKQFSQIFTEIPGKMSAEEQFNEVIKSNGLLRRYKSSSKSSDWSYVRKSNPPSYLDTDKYINPASKIIRG
jgi:CRISPR/Cas system-associated endonuclease/helicase Cas3